GGAFLLQRPRLGVDVLLRPDDPAAVDLHLEVLRQRVDHRDTDTVQTTGDGVRLAVELSAGVQHRERDLDARLLHRRMLVHGEATAVVLDPRSAVGKQRDLDARGVPGHRLVDRVVDDLPDQVVQAAFTGRADVHAGPLAYGLQAFQDGDGRCAVLVLFGCHLLRCLPGSSPQRSRGEMFTGAGHVRSAPDALPQVYLPTFANGRQGHP